MREVIYEDDNGLKHRALIRDTDHISRAPEGLRLDPPPVCELPWEDISKELHNLLVERGLLTLRDISEKPGQLGNAIQAVLRTRLINLYKENGTTEGENS